MMLCNEPMRPGMENCATRFFQHLRNAPSLAHAGLNLFGYGTGEFIAAYVYPVTGITDRFGEERELFADLYGIMFVSGFLYPVSVALAIFRLIRVIAIGKYDENSIVRYDLD